MNITTPAKTTLANPPQAGLWPGVRDHFRLSWLLLRDRRISKRRKLIFALPLAYAIAPFVIGIPDFIPVIGLLDDFMLLAISTIFFNTLCPRELAAEHLEEIQGKPVEHASLLDRFRHPEEGGNLALGFFLVAGTLLGFGSLIGLIWLLIFVAGYAITGLMRGNMLGNAMQITPRQMPRLYEIFEQAAVRLPAVDVQLFVTQNPVMNAYTFGYREPYTIVLTSELVKRLNDDELQAVIGHEIGHILFEHVRLNSLMNVPFLGLNRLFFYSWSRSCEYSADAMAWLASDQQVEPVARAFIKLATGLEDPDVHLGEFLSQLERGNGAASTTIELASSHPLIVNRIRRLMSLRDS